MPMQRMTLYSYGIITLQVDPGLCQATYLAGLAQANVLQAQSVAPKTLKIRHQHARELADWLQSTKIGNASSIGYA